MDYDPDRVYLRDTRTGRIFPYEAVLAKKASFEQFIPPATSVSKPPAEAIPKPSKD